MSLSLSLSLFQQIGKVLCSSAYLPTSRYAYAYIYVYMFIYLATLHCSAVLNWPVPHPPFSRRQNAECIHPSNKPSSQPADRKCQSIQALTALPCHIIHM
ncbi:hypothetical protein B0T24DRAFT_259409 [Lasiosphaeria ovina]|uniref:Uncharacterized protein n=1 Tax=Lasiosphaeria ovina TaxID=92902 RepID=A0AAE0N7B1_9PEZI|nr:hypothetical protein B0T24DRAFT_259409 [Lasiosphaeria ovina]